MSIRKSKCWNSNNGLQFFKRAVPLSCKFAIGAILGKIIISLSKKCFVKIDPGMVFIKRPTTFLR